MIGICAVVGMVAGILALLGYEFLDGAVFLTGGALIGFGVADSSVRAFGRRWRTVFGLAFAWLLSAMLYLLVPYGWLYTDSGTFWEPGEETFIYWLVQGVVVGLAVGAGTLGSTLVRGEMSQEEIRKRKRDSKRSLLILGGTVLGVFGLFFVAYVLLEYILAPVLRLFL